MANKRFEILEKKVDLLIKGVTQRLLVPEFKSLLKDIGKTEIKEVEEKEKDKE